MDTKRGLDRFVTFVDAVVAIAITLLVLPLVDVARAAGADEPLVRLLRDHTSELGSFLLSFVVIARLWRGHQSVVVRMEVGDRVFSTATLLWALTIVFLPFPTVLIASYGSERGVSTLYIGTILLSSLCLTATSLHVDRTPALRRTGPDPSHWSPVSAVVGSAWLAAGFVLALLVPGVNYYGLLGLLLASPTVAWWGRRRRRREMSEEV